MAAVDRWLKALPELDVYHKLDLAFIELRLGCWGFSQAYATPEIREIQPLIARESFLAMLSLPADSPIDRTGWWRALHRAVVARAPRAAAVQRLRRLPRSRSPRRAGGARSATDRAEAPQEVRLAPFGGEARWTGRTANVRGGGFRSRCSGARHVGRVALANVRGAGSGRAARRRGTCDGWRPVAFEARVQVALLGGEAR